MSSVPRALRIYQRMTALPAGKLLFSWAVCQRAPYFRTIRPRVVTLEPGRSVWAMKKRRAVHNHLGTVHALAMGNLCELCAGTLMETSLPTSRRWIPKGMQIEYLKKAQTDLVAEGRVAPEGLQQLGDVVVEVLVRDENDNVVVRANINMYVTERPAATP